MSAAEYRTYREACGQTTESASALHGVHWRTVQSWEVSRQRPSETACRQFRDLNRRIEEEVAKLVALAGGRGRRKPAKITLRRYRTEEEYERSGGVAGLNWRAHCALLARAVVALETAGAHVTVEWADQAGADPASGTEGQDRESYTDDQDRES